MATRHQKPYCPLIHLGFPVSPWLPAALVYVTFLPRPLGITRSDLSAWGPRDDQASDPEAQTSTGILKEGQWPYLLPQRLIGQSGFRNVDLLSWVYGTRER